MTCVCVCLDIYRSIFIHAYSNDMCVCVCLDIYRSIFIHAYSNDMCVCVSGHLQIDIHTCI